MATIETLIDARQWNLMAIIGLVGALAALLGGVVQVLVQEWLRRRKENVLRKEFGNDFYSEGVIRQSTRYYVRPDYTNMDPAHEPEIRQTISAKQPLFDKIDELLDDNSTDRHFILFADSGMGKSSFILNYYAQNQLQGKRKRRRLAVVPLGRPGVDDFIREVEDKKETIIFLDAFDEDTKAIRNHKKRLAELMNLCRDFRRVLITCRTQFFSRKEEIPEHTGILRIEPHAKGGKYHEFWKLYLAPFDDAKVARYIRKRFHFLQQRQRRKAQALVNKVPLLSVRPMLLTHIPDLIDEDVKVEFSFQLYEILVNKWYEREKGWIEPATLQAFSEELAIELYKKREHRGGEYIPLSELNDFATTQDLDVESWTLTGRSLLNRNAENQFKFSHRSIMEYLFVKRFLDLPVGKRMELTWTDQMKMFLCGRLKAALNESGAIPLNLDRVDLSDLPEPIYKLRDSPERVTKTRAAELIRRFDFYCAGNLNWSNPSGKGIPHDYQVDSKGEVVHDAFTGRYWQKSGSNERLTFKKAAGYIKQVNLQKLGGYSDWRLPTLEEAMSLMEPKKQSNGLYINPVFNKTQSWLWTADKESASWSWLVYFNDGDCEFFDIGTDGSFIRAVR